MISGQKRVKRCASEYRLEAREGRGVHREMNLWLLRATSFLALSLLGLPVIGHLTAYKSGHALNHQLVTKVLSEASHYAVVRARARDVAHYDLRLDELEESLAPTAA